MNRKLIFGLLAAILALGIAFFGCQNFDDPGDNPGASDPNGGSTNPPVRYESLTIRGMSLAGDDIEIVISTQRTVPRVVLSPANGDTYILRVNGVQTSTGTIRVDGDFINFFPANLGESFSVRYTKGEFVTMPFMPTPNGGLTDGMGTTKPPSNPSGPSGPSGPSNQPAYVAVTGVTLSSTSTNIYFGETETLTATVLPTNATNKAVDWSSSAPAIASVTNGVVSAIAVGQAMITVTTRDGGKTATCEVNVTDELIPVTGITALNASSNTIFVGGKTTLNVSFTPTNANTGKNFTWSATPNGAVILQPTTGVSSEATGTTAGTATIIVSLDSDPTKTASREIAVLSSTITTTEDVTELFGEDNVTVDDTTNTVTIKETPNQIDLEITIKGLTLKFDNNSQITMSIAQGRTLTVEADDGGEGGMVVEDGQSVVISGQGTLEVKDAPLEVKGSNTAITVNAGKLAVSSDSTMTVDDGATVTVSTGGTVEVSASTMTIDEGTVTVNGGAMMVNSGSTMSVEDGSSVTVSAGTLSVANGSTLEVSGGDAAVAVSGGSLTIDANSELTIEGGAELAISGGDIDIYNKVSVGSTGNASEMNVSQGNVNVFSGGKLEIGTGGKLHIATDAGRAVVGLALNIKTGGIVDITKGTWVADTYDMVTIQGAGKLKVSVNAQVELDTVIDSDITPDQITTSGGVEINLTEAFYTAANTASPLNYITVGKDAAPLTQDDPYSSTGLAYTIKGLGGKDNVSAEELTVGIWLANNNITLEDVKFNITASATNVPMYPWGNGSYYRVAVMVGRDGLYEGEEALYSADNVTVKNCEVIIGGTTGFIAGIFFRGRYVKIEDNKVEATGSSAVQALAVEVWQSGDKVINNELTAKYNTYPNFDPWGNPPASTYGAPASAFYIGWIYEYPDSRWENWAITGNTLSVGNRANDVPGGTTNACYSFYINSLQGETYEDDPTQQGSREGVDELREALFGTPNTHWVLDPTTTDSTTVKQIVNALLDNIDASGFGAVWMYLHARGQDDGINNVYEMYTIKNGDIIRIAYAGYPITNNDAYAEYTDNPDNWLVGYRVWDSTTAGFVPGGSTGGNPPSEVWLDVP